MGLDSDKVPRRGPVGVLGVLFRACLRSLQLVMALAVLGLYGVDLNTQRQNHVAGDSRWVSTTPSPPRPG